MQPYKHAINHSFVDCYWTDHERRNRSRLFSHKKEKPKKNPRLQQNSTQPAIPVEASAEMKSTLRSMLFFIAATNVSSLGLLRQTRVATASSTRSVYARTLFSIPEELDVLFAENNRSLLAQIHQVGGGSMGYRSFSMSFSMPSTGSVTASPSSSPIDQSVTASPDASVVPAPVGTTSVPVTMSPKHTGAPFTSVPVSEDSNDTIVTPVKTPAKTNTSKITKSTNRSGDEKGNPEIVIPVAFAALAVLVVGALVAARKRHHKQ
jgi:hypothetical protein